MQKTHQKNSFKNKKLLKKIPFLDKILCKNQPKHTSENYSEMVNNFYGRIKKTK